jgi:hypothetical protein
MSHEITLTLQCDATHFATLNRQTAQLDGLLDNPFSGPQPIAQTGVLEHLGTLLWEVSGLKVDELLTGIEKARDEETPVRLIVPDASLHHLPWELLYHPHPQLRFLGRHPWCVVARRFKGDGQKAPKVLPRPFRLLLFIASPEDLDPEHSRLDFEREEELLFTALDSSLSKVECAHCRRSFHVRFALARPDAEGTADTVVTCLYCQKNVMISIPQRYVETDALVRGLKSAPTGS